MKRYKQFQPLVIADFQVDEWPHPVHRHNHYELIYIKNGSGTHDINKNKLTYSKGDLFLVGPDEEHYFNIASTTNFVFIKFTDVYTQQVLPESSRALHHLEYLIKSRETHLSGFRLNEADQNTAESIISVILSLKDNVLLNEQLIWLQVLTLASLLQRNMPELKDTLHRSRDMQAVFCYLHKYIYAPEKLRASVMAKYFHMTPDYIGPYFKRNTGNTLREYIGHYRKRLILQRLKSSNYSLKQIADEFGLTDESHVSKILQGSQLLG